MFIASIFLNILLMLGSIFLVQKTVGFEKKFNKFFDIFVEKDESFTKHPSYPIYQNRTSLFNMLPLDNQSIVF